MEPLRRGGVFTCVGRLEVHHPCEGHIKAQVMAILGEQYHHWEKMRDLVQQTFAALGIPADETYEADFVCPAKQSAMLQHVDKNGYTDALVCTQLEKPLEVTKQTST